MKRGAKSTASGSATAATRLPSGAAAKGTPKDPAPPRRRGSPRRSLETRAHAVWTLADDLLLVFKPAGHRESEHAHPHRQRLRVLRGLLAVRIGTREVALGPGARGLTLPADRRHATEAIADTWLLAERIPTRR